MMSDLLQQSHIKREVLFISAILNINNCDKIKSFEFYQCNARTIVRGSILIVNLTGLPVLVLAVCLLRSSADQLIDPKIGVTSFFDNLICTFVAICISIPNEEASFRLCITVSNRTETDGHMIKCRIVGSCAAVA